MALCQRGSLLATEEKWDQAHEVLIEALAKPRAVFDHREATRSLLVVIEAWRWRNAQEPDRKREAGQRIKLWVDEELATTGFRNLGPNWAVLPNIAAASEDWEWVRHISILAEQKVGPNVSTSFVRAKSEYHLGNYGAAIREAEKAIAMCPPDKPDRRAVELRKQAAEHLRLGTIGPPPDPKPTTSPATQAVQ